ncbi:MAG: ribonuclease [Eubacteriales bacterium]|nr:ribonuclease [Eubacteriales bacterium]
MKKRTLSIILIVLFVLAGIWLARHPTATTAQPQQEPQFTSGLAALDGEQQPAASAFAENDATPEPSSTGDSAPVAPDEHGVYTSKDDVCAYLVAYGHLPENFITKEEARALGWNGGGLDDFAYGKCIGGDRFGNYEGLLPEADGRSYTECDIDTLHEDSRGAKRIVFSNDGLIYYTGDHYESFALLFGEP